jgi:hypothetical protein
MDAMKRVEDLSNMALDERTPKEERFNAAIGALRIIREYRLLGKKRVDVAVAILDRFTSPDFVDGVVSRLEKMGDGLERVMGVAKKVGGLAREAGADRGGGRRRKRRF